MSRKGTKVIVSYCLEVIKGTHWESHFYPEKSLKNEKKIENDLRNLFPDLYIEIDEELR